MLDVEVGKNYFLVFCWLKGPQTCKNNHFLVLRCLGPNGKRAGDLANSVLSIFVTSALNSLPRSKIIFEGHGYLDSHECSSIFTMLSVLFVFFPRIPWCCFCFLGWHMTIFFMYQWVFLFVLSVVTPNITVQSDIYLPYLSVPERFFWRGPTSFSKFLHPTWVYVASLPGAKTLMSSPKKSFGNGKVPRNGIFLVGYESVTMSILNQTRSWNFSKKEVPTLLRPSFPPSCDLQNGRHQSF